MTDGEKIREGNLIVKSWHKNQDSYTNDRKPDPYFLSRLQKYYPDLTIMWNNRVERWAIMQLIKTIEYYQFNGILLGMQKVVPRRLFFWKDEHDRYLDLDERILWQIRLSDLHCSDGKRTVKDL